jgi:hypothetical protein
MTSPPLERTRTLSRTGAVHAWIDLDDRLIGAEHLPILTEKFARRELDVINVMPRVGMPPANQRAVLLERLIERKVGQSCTSFCKTGYGRMRKDAARVVPVHARTRPATT